MTTIKIDTKKIKDLGSILAKMHKSSLPNAVRNTLNDLAFETKKKTLHDSTSKKFVQRNKSFFKAKSGVEKATGFDIAKMAAVVGMSDQGRASQNLAQQEEGGNIKKRAFIPIAKPRANARVGRSANKKISKRGRLSNIKFLDTKNTKGPRKQALIKTAIKAEQVGKDMLHNGTVYAVKKSKRVGGKMKLNIAPLYSYKKNRAVNVDRTNFLSDAARKSALNTDKFFKVNFTKQVERQLRRLK